MSRRKLIKKRLLRRRKHSRERGAAHERRGGESGMKSMVRIVKRGRDEGSQSLQVDDEKKEALPCEHDIASTVKGWIAEAEKRRRLSDSERRDMLIKFAQ